MNTKKKDKKENRPPIPPEVKLALWSKTAGRCQFDSCNKILNIDSIKKTYKNRSYIAHIYGFAPNSPRYDDVKSPLLAKDFSNLMLLCDDCHRRIDDKIEEKNYRAEVLIEMKKRNEERIKIVTGISTKTMIVSYLSKIGEYVPIVTNNMLIDSVIPDYYPVDHPYSIGTLDLPFSDNDNKYWEIHKSALEVKFEKLEEILKRDKIEHISLFAFAPIPLLIYLGVHLGDKRNINVHQPRRNPKTWRLSNEKVENEFIIKEPEKINLTKPVALNLSLSASINNDRITNTLGNDCSIYILTIKNPFNDFITSKSQLENFAKTIRILFNKIKHKHGQKTPLHVFPTIPVSIAIEMGRYWMPKADMSLIIYDQNKNKNSFERALKIG